MEELQLEEIDLEQLQVQNDTLPPLPETADEYNENASYNASSENRTAEYNTGNNGEVQNYDDGIDWGSLQPVDESGYRNPQQPDFDSLKPYDVTEKPASIWDETRVKMDLGNLTQYRAQLARDVMSGKMSVEDAKAATYGRHQEILNKYGITQVPEFSFAKFKQNPFRTVIGESAQMLPFYWGGMKKGAAASLVTVPAAVGKNMAAGAAAGSVAPGAGTAAGGGAGIISGVIEGVNNGMLIGTFAESMEVEGGNLYLDMREKGIDHKTAMATSLAGGLLDGILETASFGVMTAPVKGAAKKAAAKLLWDGMKKSPAIQATFRSVLTKATTEYFKRIGAETSTEMIQDVVNNTMTLLAAQADSVESAKPTAGDWKNIITKTGPQTAASMLLMGAFSTPFDVMNAKVGGVKNEGGSFEAGTKEEVMKNLQDHAEGKEVITGGTFTLQGRVTMEEGGSEIAFDTAEEGSAQISELEAEFKESQASMSKYEKELAKWDGIMDLSEDEAAHVETLKQNIQTEKDYQGLIREEIAKTSAAMTKKETTQGRKQELTEKGKKEKLSAEELQELNDIWIEEEKAKGEQKANENTQKARERELDKNIRDLDKKIENSQKKEDSTRENRNKIENQIDENTQKISELEKENSEIQKSLKDTETESDIAEMKTTLKKNREQISDLKKNNKTLEKQRERLNSEIENAMAEGDTLANERQGLNEERSKLSEGIIDENGKVDMTAGGYKNVQLSALKTRLKAMQQGIKRGIVMTRREIRDVQNSAIGIIKNSGLPAKDKAKFLTTIRDMNTREKFNKGLPALFDKIAKLEDEHNRKSLGQYIGKLLKKAKPKKGGKRPEGKFNADIQRILDKITDAASLTQEQAESRIENIFDNAGERALTDDETETVRILFNYGGLKSKNVHELLSAARSIKMLLEDGKIAGEFREQAKKEHKEKIIAEAKESIIGTVEPTYNRKKDFKNEVKQAFRRFNVISEGWDGLMQIASLHDKDRKLAKILDVFPSKMARIKGEMDSFNKFAEMAMEALGCKNEREFNNRVKRDTRIEDVGVYTDADGNKKKPTSEQGGGKKIVYGNA